MTEKRFQWRGKRWTLMIQKLATKFDVLICVSSSEKVQESNILARNNKLESHMPAAMRKLENQTRGNQTRGLWDPHRHFSSWTGVQKIKEEAVKWHTSFLELWASLNRIEMSSWTHSQKRSPSSAVECKASYRIRVDVMLIPKRAHPPRKTSPKRPSGQPLAG